MKFCSQCGSDLVRKTPENDNTPRLVCNRCHHIHYQNPIVVAGCIPIWNGQILMCRRAIEPGYGYWTVPGGFVEIGETVQHCAEREALEEARVEVTIGRLISVINVTKANQVHMFFEAQMLHNSFAPGEESMEVKLHRPEHIPWSDIAFCSVEQSLRKVCNREPIAAPSNEVICSTSTRAPKQLRTLVS